MGYAFLRRMATLEAVITLPVRPFPVSARALAALRTVQAPLAGRGGLGAQEPTAPDPREVNRGLGADEAAGYRGRGPAARSRTPSSSARARISAGSV